MGLHAWHDCYHVWAGAQPKGAVISAIGNETVQCNTQLAHLEKIGRPPDQRLTIIVTDYVSRVSGRAKISLLTRQDVGNHARSARVQTHFIAPFTRQDYASGPLSANHVATTERFAIKP